MKKETNQSFSEESQGLCCCTALYLPFEKLITSHSIIPHLYKVNILHKSYLLRLYHFIICNQQALHKCISKTTPHLCLLRMLWDPSWISKGQETQLKPSPCFLGAPGTVQQPTCIPYSQASALSTPEMWTEATSPSLYSRDAEDTHTGTKEQ